MERKKLKKVHALGEDYIRNLNKLEPCVIELADGTQTVGLLPDDVYKIFPALVVLDREKKPSSVRYDLLSILALLEVKSLHDKLAAFYRDYRGFRDGTEKAILNLTNSRKATSR